MSKIRIIALALSVNEEILTTHFLKTWHHMKITPTINYDLTGVIFTQGFDISTDDPSLRITRDDSHYQSGYTISEIRDYFTKIAIEKYHPDYILHCDDDFKFTDNSKNFLTDDIEYAESHPDVGVMCMYHTSRSATPYDLNPSQVATRSGILIRTDAFVTWGGESKVKYFEECVMAVHAYREGYRVVHTTTSTVHNTKPTGLGRSLEIKYGENNIPNNGRKIMCDEGYLLPAISKQDGSKRYDTTTLDLSPKLREEHDHNHMEKFCRDERK